MTGNWPSQLNKLATVTASGSVSAGKHNSFNPASGALVATLPLLTTGAVAAALAAGQIVRTKISKSKVDLSSNAVTVTCAGSDTFEGGSTTVALLAAGEKLTLTAAILPGGSGPVWVVEEHTVPRDILDGRYATRARSRVVWSLGDSTAAGAPAGSSADSEVAASVPAAKSSITFQTTSWQPWGVLASQGKWTLGGIVATGGYTSAQIRDTLLPQLLAVAKPGDTVVVQAGTNSQVIADTKNIYDALRAAGLYTVAVSIAPSTASTVTLVEQFNALLKDYCNTNGIPLVDSYGLFCDPTSAAYRSNFLLDGVHPNTAGFQALGQLIASTLNNIFSTDPGLLVRHNAVYAPQKVTKPLGGGANGTDYGLFSSLGTSTITTVSDTDFQGGQCYALTRGDSAIQADFVGGNRPTLTAGRKYRLGFALKTAISVGATWQVALESNTTGTRHLWGFGYPSYMSANQSSIGRMYSEFVCAVTDVYRLRVALAGTGTAGDLLKIGEITFLDLTAEGVA